MGNLTKDTLNKNLFGIRLNELLKENNMTMSSAAEIVHLSPSTLSRYIKGEMSPKITVIEKLADHFCVSPSWLMGLNCSPFIGDDKKIKTDLLTAFDSLNLEGKKEALKQIRLISQIPSYLN